MEEYKTWIEDRLPLITDSLDMECVRRCIEDCFRGGFTKEDVLAYLKFTEHVNPGYYKKYACYRMGLIASKYRNIHPIA